MSLLPMYRQCTHCRRRYSYNPSMGRLGLICPYCGKPQFPLTTPNRRPR